MYRKTTLITLTFLSAALLATAAQARPPRGDRGPRVDRMVEKLDLDETQEQQVRALAEQKRWVSRWMSPEDGSSSSCLKGGRHE